MTTHSIRTRLVAPALMVLGMLSTPAFAAAPAPAPTKEAPPAAAAPKPFKVPVRTEFKLDNGLEVSLLPYGDMPKVAIQLAIDTGNIHEKATETWLADLTGKLLSEGTTTRSAEQIAQAAAQLGGSLNIGTTMDQTFVGLEVLSESAPDAVALIADVIQNPAFPPAEVERVKGDLVREMAIYKSRPGTLADERLLQSLYGDHPYGRYFPPEAQLKGYTPEAVRAHYDANIGAARARLYVVGRFESASVEKAIRAAFTGWKAGPARLQNVPKQKVAKAVQFIDRPGSVQSTVRVAVKGLPPSSPDYVKQTVLNTLLGGYFSSRITANIREAKGYTYSPYSDVSTHLEDAYWVQNADVTTAVTGESLKEILKEVATLRKTPPPADELSAVQSYLAGSFLLQNSSRGGIINQLRFVDLHGLPDSYLQNYVQSVMAVTPEQVQQLAAKMLAREAMTFIVVGDQKVVAPQLKVVSPALK
ncbi:MULTISPECIES: M16 family metallopeptidase [Myxococcus]|uniref:M16 family metallopeptidase n=1 Tax=Myxococcus TaxID=32 RepID=UPI00112600FA|nr:MULTISPECIES: pitrilysin family protein [Myxococcus]QDE81503.1 peptidase M16 [Myxococcus xanthus]QDE95832.1 peptidase M16 [Myxococcus xanthus]QDF03147.1 peptidase M16 [Myxococcus xanthus]WAM28072.1 pitrilysin family protein [Myxococcus sp. NMCA1]